MCIFVCVFVCVCVCVGGGGYGTEIGVAASYLLQTPPPP